MKPQIPSYNLDHKLGEGGMAVVWYATNTLGKPFAIKFLNRDMIGKENIVERFRNEAKVMVSLNHPHIRQVFDYYEDSNTMAIIMEYLEGEDLGKYLTERGPVTEAQAVRWFNDVLDAMTYVHQKGYIHRDIKPSNLFLTESGAIRVMDFGIAKIIDSNQELTHTQTSIGSPQYMSPEQITTPKAIDLRSDIYSLGVTLYALLTGKKPYNDSYGSSYMIQAEIVKAPLPIIPGVSNAVNAAIQKATSKSLQDRFQNCQEFKKALSQMETFDDETLVVVDGNNKRPPIPPPIPHIHNQPKPAPIPQPLYNQNNLHNQNNPLPQPGPVPIPVPNPGPGPYPYPTPAPKSNTLRYVLIGIGIFAVVLGGLIWFGIQIKKDEIRKGVELTDKEKYTEAFNLLYKNRDSDYMTPEALHDLGYMYASGNGTQLNYSEAMAWYRKAADQGLPVSYNNIGVMYRYGEGVSVDYSYARECFEKAAKEGVLSAKYNLGDIYYEGLGVPTDYYEAYKWYREAADKGHAGSQYKTGLCYALGRGVYKNNTEAVSWYRKSADQGYADAQNELGYMYGTGNVNGRYEYYIAKSWFERAATQNQSNALYNLGLYYEYGYGTTKNWTTALDYYRKAARLGNEKAQKQLSGYGYSWK